MNNPRTTSFILAIVLSLSLSCATAQATITQCQALDLDQSTLKSQGNSNVQITEGQYFVSIDGNHANQSFIVTPSITIHASCAKLIVQVSATRVQVAVLSGSAVIKNVSEKHIIEVRKGTIYTCRILAGTGSPYRQSSFEHLAQPGSSMPLFHTSKFHTSLSLLSGQAISSSRFSSMVSPQDQTQAQTRQAPDATIISPPTMMSYQMGEQLFGCLKMSALLKQNFPPDGVITRQPEVTVAEQSDNAD